MTSFPNGTGLTEPKDRDNSRLDYLDATRAFALLLGVLFHASLSFSPVFMGWAVQDVSTSAWVARFIAVSHSFRMETFFLLAGLLGHLTFQRKGAGEFVRSRLLRIVAPFVAGWFILRPLLVSGWIMGAASLRGPVDIRAGLLGGVQSFSTLPAGIFTGSHLWFLYYLSIITALTLVARALLASTSSWRLALLRPGDAIVAWLANSPGALPILAIPTAFALWQMRFWGMDTPDQSLVPHLPALTIYGGFFVLGWMLHRQRELVARFARLTPWRCGLTGIGVSTILLLGGIESDPGHPHYLAAHAAYAFGYALTMWSLAFLTIGVFHKLCPKPNALARYVADSSYWMYLIHLPVVIWTQVAVAELQTNWTLKLAFVSAVAVGASLITYDLFVRSTFIGWVLNGKRRDRVLVPLTLGGIRRLWRSLRLRPVISH